MSLFGLNVIVGIFSFRISIDEWWNSLLTSIGRVNADLYGLVADTLNLEDARLENCQNQSKLEQWMQNYVNVLCINSWQVHLILALDHKQRSHNSSLFHLL